MAPTTQPVPLPVEAARLLEELERERKSGTVTFNIANGTVVGMEVVLRTRFDKT